MKKISLILGLFLVLMIVPAVHAKNLGDPCLVDQDPDDCGDKCLQCVLGVCDAKTGADCTDYENEPCWQGTCDSSGTCNFNGGTPYRACPAGEGKECNMCDGTNKKCVTDPNKLGKDCPTCDTEYANNICYERKCAAAGGGLNFAICASPKVGAPCDHNCHVCNSAGLCDTTSHVECDPDKFGKAAGCPSNYDNCKKKAEDAPKCDSSGVMVVSRCECVRAPTGCTSSIDLTTGDLTVTLTGLTGIIDQSTGSMPGGTAFLTTSLIANGVESCSITADDGSGGTTVAEVTGEAGTGTLVSFDVTGYFDALTSGATQSAVYGSDTATLTESVPTDTFPGVSGETGDVTLDTSDLITGDGDFDLSNLEPVFSAGPPAPEFSTTGIVLVLILIAAVALVVFAKKKENSRS